MQIKLILGYSLAFLIGVGCRLLEIPLPAPTALLGAFIVLSLTSGYLLTDKLMHRQEQD
ncbi:MAG: XapX domain-containing protein [Pseudomonadales bacterium]|nr:XapX domain-containing protein [Pseudomonadales bacterium]